MSSKLSLPRLAKVTRDLRMQRGLTQVQLSGITGINPMSLS